MIHDTIDGLRRDDLQWLTALTTEAGTKAVQMVQAGISAKQKADGSLVTEVDHAIEAFLREKISQRFPTHAILGEEYGYTGDRNAPLWAIDPIDGTTNLANGLPLWGVSVGLIEEDAPVLGGLCFPLLGEVYAGAKGLGATRNGVSLKPLPSGGATTWDDTVGSCSTSVRTFARNHINAKVRVLGSAALEVCWTATGQLKACQSVGISLYDVAAGLCIAFETGAVAEWQGGKPYSPRKHANGEDHGTLIVGPAPTVAYLQGKLR